MKFTKMHGIGNDYIYINCFAEEVKDPEELSIAMSDRHFGIGSDGLVLILPSNCADFRMRMFNSDGSESEMCGNAIRCVGKYVYDNKLTDKEVITIETLAGIKTLVLRIENNEVQSLKVDMGEPVLTPENIPVLFKGENFINQPVTISYIENGKQVEQTYQVTAVSMGNPHIVIFLPEIADLNLEKLGPLFEHNSLFPRRTNTEFVQVKDRHNLKMRVWERGAGETLACGTGACAATVAAVLNGLCERKVCLELLGGSLEIHWSEEDNHIYMTGSATKVFEGEYKE